MAKRSKPLEPVDKHVADALAELAQNSGLTQSELGDMVGLSQNRVGKILRKEPPPASIGEADKLATALGGSLENILDDYHQHGTVGHLSVVPDSINKAAAQDRNVSEADESEIDQQEP